MNDKREKKYKKWKIFLFGIITSSTGLIYGFSLSLFNSFFDIYMQKLFPEVKSDEFDNFKSQMNTMFSIGGILCTIGSSYLIHLFGRRTINYSLIILNSLSSAMLLIPFKWVVLLARFISGTSRFSNLSKE